MPTGRRPRRYDEPEQEWHRTREQARGGVEAANQGRRGAMEGSDARGRGLRPEYKQEGQRYLVRVRRAQPLYNHFIRSSRHPRSPHLLPVPKTTGDRFVADQPASMVTQVRYDCMPTLPLGPPHQHECRGKTEQPGCT